MAVDTEQFENHRKKLTGHCYRMLGSALDAEDAVQETMLRALRAADRFEERAAVSTWLYRIATNVCLDTLSQRSRRRLPPEDGQPYDVKSHKDDAPLTQEAAEHWLEPIPDAWIFDTSDDPAARAQMRQSVHLAFVAAVQRLSPTQRAAFLCTQVLGLSAQEVSEALQLSIASVNSAVQRAKANLAPADLESANNAAVLSEEQRETARRFHEAFERYDMNALTELLTADVTMSMPPYILWLCSADAVTGWNLGPGAGCRGSRFVPIEANGQLGFAQYRQGGREPWSLVTLGFRGEKISTLIYFLETERLFPSFGLPLTLNA